MNETSIAITLSIKWSPSVVPRAAASTTFTSVRGISTFTPPRVSETPETLGGVKVEIPRTDVNVVDAAARGTTDGLHLMLNVIAMLVSFIALVALLNGAFGWVHRYVAWFPANIQTVLGWVFSP